MDLTVLMPMGGLGKRFLDAGYTTPKPLIKVDGKPMFIKALESFPSSWNIDNVFVIRKNQDDEYNLGEFIRRECPNAKIVVFDYNTKGPVETTLLAESMIIPENPIIIADCDIRFSSRKYISKIDNGNVDGLLVSFSSSDPRYSYAETDLSGMVIRTAEKKVISNNALLGGYYFSSGKLYLELAHKFFDAPLPVGIKEYYLSYLFNIMLETNQHVELAKVDYYDIWGTPEELERYLEKMKGVGNEI